MWKNRLIKDGALRFLEFGPLNIDLLQRLGIKADRLGPRLVSCMWNEESPLETGGFLVVDNLAMGGPSMGGTRMLPDITPDIIFNLARGMTLKNAAADLPFGGGKSGIVQPDNLSGKNRYELIKGFGQLLNRYKKIYIPGPDVGTNDADMKIFAIENGLNNVVSKPADMGGNRIDELGGAANGVVVATKALLEHLPKLKQLPQFKNIKIPKPCDLDILIQGFGAEGAHAARIFHDYDPDNSPIIKGISDATGYLLNPYGLPVKELFDMWKKSGAVTLKYFHECIVHIKEPGLKNVTFSNAFNNLLTESAFCMIPASPVPNYLDVNNETNPSMTTDRMGKWQIIVEGANTYSPNPAKKARDIMEKAPTISVDKSVTDAAELLVDASVSIVNVVSEKGKLIGIVTNWDITKAMASKLPMDSPLTRVMTADVITGSPDDTIIDCIRMLENHEISAMPIVKNNKVIGVISGDILARRTLFRLLQTMK